MPARIWAVVPAAGVGQRFGERRPKQYLEVGGRPMLARVLALLLAEPEVAGVAVALAPGDPFWPGIAPVAPAKPVITAPGGATRAESVLAALAALAPHAGAGDWALVHDAARPCLEAGELARFIRRLAGDPVGGLLAAPVVDTLKRADAQGRVAATAERSGLWRALTPQMFRFALLRAALRAALERGIAVTDESMAMELAGHAPALVEGGAGNVKITRREDLALAEAIVAGGKRVRE